MIKIKKRQYKQKQYKLKLPIFFFFLFTDMNQKDFADWLRGLPLPRQTPPPPPPRQHGETVHQRIDHPLIYRETFHECSWQFNTTTFQPVPTVHTTSRIVLAEYVHFSNPRFITVLPPDHDLCRGQQIPTYHFLIQNGTTMAGPYVQRHT